MAFLPEDPKHKDAAREIRWLLVDRIVSLKGSYPLLADREAIEPTLAYRLTRIWEGMVRNDPERVAAINAQLAPLGYAAVGIEHEYVSDTMCHIGVSVVPLTEHSINQQRTPGSLRTTPL